MMMPVNGDPVPWEQVFHGLAVPLSLIDTHGRQVACNAAYAEFLGYGADEVTDIDVGRITRDEDQPWTRNYLMRLVRGEIDDFETDKVYVRKDGSEVTARLTAHALRDEFGECVLLVGALSPTSGRAARSDPQRVNRLLEFTGDTLTLLDIDGNVIETKGLHTPLLGYPTAFWQDRNIVDVVAPHDVERLLTLREQVVAEPDAQVETEIEIQASDGAAQTLHLRAINCLDDPDLRGIVVVTRNITEQRELLAELSRGRETAEAVVDAQTRLLATVSHELRNPLHAVSGMAELLAQEELPPRVAQLADSLVRQISGLAHVTQDLLDAARLDAGKVEIDAVPVEVAGLVDDVVGLGRAAAGDRPVDVSHRIAHGVPDVVIADGNRLRQVLGNLVGNAVKFTERGTVQLVVRPDGEHALTFSVIDTGVGIPPEEQVAVLEPFTVGSTAGNQRGAGLGLSIVQRLVLAMNGRVTLTSTLGAGTRFDVRLPLVAAERADVEHVDRALPQGLRVLVVEDNPVNQQLATSQLERLGLHPIVVGTGEDGLEYLTGPDGVGVDVVLMDHQLPGISGIETTQRVRELDAPIRSLPIIGLSASGSASDRDGFVSAGMNDFLPKPASLDDLRTAIARAVHGENVGSGDGSVEPGAPAPSDGRSLVESALDVGVLAQLATELGGDEIVTNLVQTFLGELDDRAAVILSGLSDDPVAARRGAHTLKSSARLLGAGPLADACAELERRDGTTATGAGSTSSSDVAALCEATRSALERWLGRAQGA